MKNNQCKRLQLLNQIQLRGLVVRAFACEAW